MSTLCHNCGNAVPERAAYCPECGVPQLRVQTTEQREQAQRELAQLGADGSPPTGSEPLLPTGDIDWPAALQCAAIFAVPAGLLISLRENPGFFDMIWVVLGAIWALRLYRRRAPRAPALTPLLGGRIGLLLGLFASALMLVVQASRLLIERYGMHHGAAIDARLQSYAQMEIDLINASNPDAARQFAWLAHFWVSPEGKGVLLLLTMVSAVVSTLFFGWIAGRLSVRFSAGRPRKR